MATILTPRREESKFANAARRALSSAIDQVSQALDIS